MVSIDLLKDYKIIFLFPNINKLNCIREIKNKKKNTEEEKKKGLVIYLYNIAHHFPFILLYFMHVLIFMYI